MTDAVIYALVGALCCVVAQVLAWLAVGDRENGR